MPKLDHIPTYRKHKPTGRAVMTIGGRDIYLGQRGRAESRAEYNRLAGEFLSGNRVLTNKGLSIAKLPVGFMQHARR